VNGEQMNYDVIVIGGGAMGNSAAFHLSKRRVRALLLEQFTFFNQLGSSAGVSRQFRIPYPEEYMVQLVQQSVPFWDELQSLTPVPLLDKVGTLWFGDPTVHTSEGNIGEAEKALDARKVPYTKLTAREIERTYHFTNLPPTYTGLFQPDGASIDLRATIRTLHDWNLASPFVTMLDEAPVTRIMPRKKSFEVTTPQGTFTAEKLVITPGPYANGVFHLLGFHIAATYWNMASAYYKITRPGTQYPRGSCFRSRRARTATNSTDFPRCCGIIPGTCGSRRISSSSR
jgi:glycine/D-amino acid oxidase-like deaminating enzyme